MKKSTDNTAGAHLDALPAPVARMDVGLRVLYQKIMQFEIDDGPVDVTFAQRLALENGWSLAFSERVIREYKHFIFLLASAGHPVTPSDQVDQAWHLHLAYTRSYWDGLCGDVIGRPLHHTPTQGGHAELRKFDIWYFATLTSYRRMLGQPPPADIWADPADRFRDVQFFQRINTRRHWVIRKPRGLRAGTRAARLLMAIGGLAVALGAAVPLFAASAANNTSGENSFPTWLVFILPGVFIAGLILLEGRCSACRRFRALKKPASSKLATTPNNGTSTGATIAKRAFGSNAAAGVEEVAAAGVKEVVAVEVAVDAAANPACGPELFVTFLNAAPHAKAANVSLGITINFSNKNYFSVSMFPRSARDLQHDNKSRASGFDRKSRRHGPRLRFGRRTLGCAMINSPKCCGRAPKTSPPQKRRCGNCSNKESISTPGTPTDGELSGLRRISKRPCASGICWLTRAGRVRRQR